ncbi:MAG: conjugal transfer protein TraN [Leeuwenhoekiella sp.]|nr:conjugal transfer protein TraN [Leeuwenhoekiella sp.]MBA83012.1 conjugal transfer protein TraN [Leeuwenhoekiella sp.]|tara:strand:- start:3649 stop:4485 length:837 start_codon:yes stop_codon:yes gene_type:complete
MYASVWMMVLSCYSARGQNQNAIQLDTIYANDYTNVALFFPESIRQGIVGSKDFVFSFNRDEAQHLGLLQAKPGRPSNLLVISTTGSVFSYLVMYKESINRYTYFVDPQERIGTETSNYSNPIHFSGEVKTSSGTPPFPYDRYCEYLIQKKQKIGRLKTRNQGIILSVENIVFHKDALYFVMEIENRSGLDYDFNYMSLSNQTRLKGKRKSMQKLPKEPLFTHQVPKKIIPGEVKRFVYVVPKFSLSRDRRLIVDLVEAQGERVLKLKINPKYINYPN